MPVRYAIIIPASNEEPCLRTVLRELRGAISDADFVIVLGINGSSDATARIGREEGALVAETPLLGYGYGCQAAIELAKKKHPEIEAFVFFAADGANDPRDISTLVKAFGQDCDMVLGSRTDRRANWPIMSLQHVLANALLAAWCSCLTGRWFRDLGPLRIIRRNLFDEMRLRELTFGWTIEAQVSAARLGARIREVPVHERRRIAGEQKVSRVSWRRTLRIGAHIMAAGWRARFRAPAANPAVRNSCAHLARS